ncbi:MAG: hypothetical protein LBV23_07125 [Deltaproteobacteria bacterium]|jgi:tetratricopeptide (TPR) repeat protein|nr:hypothetical protein [Deltaproteobacteria bacterium]
MSKTPENSHAHVKALHEALDRVFDMVYSTMEAKPASEQTAVPVEITSEQAYENHKKASKLALSCLEVRDCVEKVARNSFFPGPKGLETALARLVTIYDRLDNIDDSRAYFDQLKTLVDPKTSALFLAEAVNVLIMGYLDHDRLEEAVEVYREHLYLDLYLEAASGLVRAAFYLVSKFVIVEDMDKARDIYETMERFGGGASQLTLVSPKESNASNLSTAPSLDADSLTHSPERPRLTLIASATPTGSASLSGGEPHPLADIGDYDDIGVVRAQAAVNVISGYAMTGQAEKALEVYGAMPAPVDSEEYVSLRSMAAVNLICVYIHDHRWNEAMAIFKEMEDLGRLGDNSVFIGKAVVEIIGFTDKAHLSQAEALYESLASRGSGPDFDLERIRAAGNLIYVCGEFGKLAKARAIFDTLVEFGNSEPILAVRAKATVNLMSDYCAARKIKEAETLYASMDLLGDNQALAESRAEAAHNLMTGYFRAKRYSDAIQTFYSRAKLGDLSRVVFVRARAAFCLVTEFLQEGQMSTALKIYAGFNSFPLSRPVLVEWAKAMVNLVHFCGDNGRRDQARDYFNTLLGVVNEFIKNGGDIETDPLRHPELSSHNEDVSDSPFGGAGAYMDVISRHSDSENPEENLHPIDLLGKAAFNLVYDYTDAGALKQAEEVYRTMLTLNSRPEVTQDAAQAGVHLLTKAWLSGRVKMSVGIYKSFSKLPVNDKIDSYRARAVLSLMNLSHGTKNLDLLEDLYSDIKKLSPPEKYGYLLARASQSLVQSLGLAKRIDEAKLIYEAISTLGNEPRIVECRAKAAVSLMYAYEAQGYVEEALNLYFNLSKMGESPKLIRNRLKAAKRLIKCLKKSGRYNEASMIEKEYQEFMPY